MRAERRSSSPAPAATSGLVAAVRAPARSPGDRAVAVWLALAGVAAAAWIVVLRRADGGEMAMGGVAPLPFLVSWVPMMTAMMFPSVAPAATLWMRSIAGRSTGPAAWARIGAFLSPATWRPGPATAWSRSPPGGGWIGWWPPRGPRRPPGSGRPSSPRRGSTS